MDFTSSAVEMIPGMGFNVIQELRSNQSISRRTHYGSDGPSRRRQGKGSSNNKHSSHKQGLFHSSFRGHSHGRIQHGIIAESPPSNSVGFLVGYTSPENQGPMSSRLSASPVGSMPKWVQAAKVLEVSQALSK
ncbi:hypothetical protein H6P81_003003 [Aristolochia fimbriata]|uniref:Uncharacterized protein n=1 Tax=Aristolochia fimbriata TaxID=158543 RepID=A0AAV7FBC0_ARIFI|nr:hypothetical protein H6P81_003003 [Aristolochia fimbriata]